MPKQSQSKAKQKVASKIVNAIMAMPTKELVRIYTAARRTETDAAYRARALADFSQKICAREGELPAAEIERRFIAGQKANIEMLRITLEDRGVQIQGGF